MSFSLALASLLLVAAAAAASASTVDSSPLFSFDSCSPNAPRSSLAVPCFSACSSSVSLSSATAATADYAAFYGANSACALRAASHGFEAFSNAHATPDAYNSTVAAAYIEPDCLVSAVPAELASGYYTDCVDTPSVFFDFVTRASRGAAYRVSVVSDATAECTFSYGANNTGGVSLTLYESCALNAQPLYCARSADDAPPSNAFDGTPLIDMFIEAGALTPYTLYRLRLRSVDDDDCGCFTVCVAALVPPENAECEHALPLRAEPADTYEAVLLHTSTPTAMVLREHRKRRLEARAKGDGVRFGASTTTALSLNVSLLAACKTSGAGADYAAYAAQFAAGDLYAAMHGVYAGMTSVAVGGFDSTYSAATKTCFVSVEYVATGSGSAGDVFAAVDAAYTAVRTAHTALRTSFLSHFRYPTADDWTLGSPPPPTPTPAPTEGGGGGKTPAPPTPQPSALPTAQPTPLPTVQPTLIPTPLPTAQPTPLPTSQPTPLPSVMPTQYPTPAPTSFPTNAPSNFPTPLPTNFPTPLPTAAVTSAPTNAPLVVPPPPPMPPPPTGKGGSGGATPAPTPLPTVQPTSSSKSTPAPPTPAPPSPYDAQCTAAEVEAAFPCCAPHAERACFVASCCVAVCEFRASCCTSVWDVICVSIAASQCGAVCSDGAYPTPAFTPRPTPLPTPGPTPGPTPLPTPPPTAFPTPQPTPFPTAFPTPLPTPQPTLPQPTPSPTPLPTPQPTPPPTPTPPTPQPTPQPTSAVVSCPLIGTCTSATGDAFSVCTARSGACPTGSAFDAAPSFGSACVASDPTQSTCGCCARACNADFATSPCSAANPSQDTVCVPRGTCVSHFNGAMVSSLSCSASVSAASAACECCSLTSISTPAPPPDAPYTYSSCATGSQVCTPSSLGGATCQSLGFASGTLACESTCDAYDVSGCVPYGVCCTSSSTCVADVTSCSGSGGGVFVPHATECTPRLCAAVYSGASPFQRARQTSLPFEAGSMVSSTNAFVYTGATSCTGGCYIGTWGAVVQNNSIAYALSNAHVLASPAGASPDVAGGCSVRSPPHVGTTRMFQSSGCATTSSGTHAGTLAAFTQLTPNSWQVADAAVAQLVVAASAVQMGLGAVGSATPVAPTLGMVVVKSSATTSLAVGQVVGINGNVRVWYGTDDGVSNGAYPVLFRDQVICVGLAPSVEFSLGGDSGGVIFEASTMRAVSLNFAGAPGISISSPMSVVLSELFGSAAYTSGSARMYTGARKRKRQGSVNFDALRSGLDLIDVNPGRGGQRHLPTHFVLNATMSERVNAKARAAATAALATTDVEALVAEATGSRDHLAAYYVAYDRTRLTDLVWLVVGIDEQVASTAALVAIDAGVRAAEARASRKRQQTDVGDGSASVAALMYEVRAFPHLRAV